jgi:hypothetical protein
MVCTQYFPDEASRNNLGASIVQSLMQMVDEHIPFAKQFRIARDRLQDTGDEEFTI